MRILSKEIALAARALRRSPGFLVVAVLTLALGIGANTAIFTVVRAVLLEPLPYAQPDRILRYWTYWTAFPRGSISEPEFFDYLDQNEVFDQIAIYRGRDLNLTATDGDPQRTRLVEVSGQFFPLLGVGALHGRTLGEEDDRPGARRAVVASHGFWQRSLGADPAAVGSSLRIEGEEHIIVGVMPARFGYPRADVDLWRATRLDRASLSTRGSHNFSGIAKTREGISFEQAQSHMSSIAARLAEAYPDNYPEDSGFGIVLVPLFEHTVGSARPALLVLLAAVGFVLLIACSNVANLTLVRSSAKAKEMALRSALGAGRVRLIAGSLAESTILAAAGLTVGVMVARGALWILSRLGPEAVPRLEEAGLDGSVLLFAVVLSALTVLLFGLAPAWRASRKSLGLGQSGRTTSGPESHRLRDLLVVVQITLAVVLLAGAGLLIRSFDQLRRVDPGFRTERVLTMVMSLGEDRYPEAEHRARFFGELVEVVSSLPGVASAGATTNPPLSGWTNDNSIEVEGFTEPTGFSSFDELRMVSGRYFETLAIPLLAGETFTGRETSDSAPVVVVSESLAKKYWAKESPIGKRLRMSEDQPWKTVIGVVGDVRHLGPAEPVRPTYYLPHAQRPWRSMTVMVRSVQDPDSLVASLREAAARIDATQPVYNFRLMDGFAADAVAGPRFNLLLLGAFAFLALSLAAVGIYGVLAYTVGQRRQEIGIRMALGASGRAIPWLVVRQGVRLTSLGLVLGLGAAMALSQLLSSLLFGISTRDPLTFIAVPLVLAAVALAACYLPARRAARVDPMIALRYE